MGIGGGGADGGIGGGDLAGGDDEGAPPASELGPLSAVLGAAGGAGTRIK